MKVLILKAGDAANAVRVTHGDYDRWFVNTLGPGAADFDTVQAHLNQKLPNPGEYAAIIVTGSPQSVTEPKDWMRRAASWLREAGETTPVLGVCFGHQLLAYAFDKPVARNPKGRELGTIEVALTPEGAKDPLFEGLPRTITVQATHEDIVPDPPREATVLAGNDFCAVQAFAIGPYIRAVQFHPEVHPSTMSALIRARNGRASLLARVRPTPHGAQILRNFLSHFTS